MPASDGETLKRANACLALYFDPDNDPETRAAIRQSFVRALAHVPTWAMHRAFDAWERGQTRRPSPGEIVILAEREIKPMADELARRQREEERAAEEAAAARINRVTPEAAARILAEAGMTDAHLAAVKRFPLARSSAELATLRTEAVKPKPSWADSAPPDDPRWDMLRKSRAASGICDPSQPRKTTRQHPET